MGSIPIISTYAGVTELADVYGLDPYALNGRAGSTPAISTYSCEALSYLILVVGIHRMTCQGGRVAPSSPAT